jgi:ABC-2 type transport system permease protein
VWEVARREIVERSRSGTLRVSLVILLVFAVGGAVAAARLDEPTPTDDIALVGARSIDLSSAIRLQARAQDRRVRLHVLPDRPAAVRAVRDGAADVALVDASRIVVAHTRSSDAAELVQAAVRGATVVDRLRATGLSETQALATLTAAPLAADVIDPHSHTTARNEGLLFAGTLVLFVALATFGSAVAASVTEEKSSRMVEVLLTTVSPRRLLAGKVLGIGALGITEIVIVGAAALAAGRLAGGAGLPSAAPGTLALIALWFVLGYAFYSAAFGAVGALVSRQEDLETATGPITLVMTAALLLTLVSLEEPNGTIVTIAGFLPPTAPMVVPTRVVLGDMTGIELVLSIALSLVGTFALVLVSARIYERALLRVGAPVHLRQVLGGPGAPLRSTRAAKLSSGALILVGAVLLVTRTASPLGIVLLAVGTALRALGGTGWSLRTRQHHR